MWTNQSYQNLKTFNEYLADVPDLFNGTPFEDDEALIDDLTDWFYYRKVVDNERFERYFRRAIKRYSVQFYNYLRIESTDFDPLVSNYLERQIKRSVNRASSETANASRIGGGGHTTRTTSNDTGVVDTNTTGSATNRGTSDTTSEDSTDTTSTGTSNTKSKHGETPQAAVGSGGSMALDWTYLSSQDENETHDSNTTQGESEGETHTVSTDNSTTAGTSRTQSTANGTATTTTTDNSNETNESTREMNGNENGEDRERMTGRNQSPQEMLTAAREYIESTNAFNWLIKKLDDCFMQVFEV